MAHTNPITSFRDFTLPALPTRNQIKEVALKALHELPWAALAGLTASAVIAGYSITAPVQVLAAGSGLAIAYSMIDKERFPLCMTAVKVALYCGSALLLGSSLGQFYLGAAAIKAAYSTGLSLPFLTKSASLLQSLYLIYVAYLPQILTFKHYASSLSTQREQNILGRYFDGLQAVRDSDSSPSEKIKFWEVLGSSPILQPLQHLITSSVSEEKLQQFLARSEGQPMPTWRDCKERFPILKTICDATILGLRDEAPAADMISLIQMGNPNLVQSILTYSDLLEQLIIFKTQNPAATLKDYRARFPALCTLESPLCKLLLNHLRLDPIHPAAEIRNLMLYEFKTTSTDPIRVAKAWLRTQQAFASFKADELPPEYSTIKDRTFKDSLKQERIRLNQRKKGEIANYSGNQVMVVGHVLDRLGLTFGDYKRLADKALIQEFSSARDQLVQELKDRGIYCYQDMLSGHLIGTDLSDTRQRLSDFLDGKSLSPVTNPMSIDLSKAGMMFSSLFNGVLTGSSIAAQLYAAPRLTMAGIGLGFFQQQAALNILEKHRFPQTTLFYPASLAQKCGDVSRAFLQTLSTFNTTTFGGKLFTFYAGVSQGQTLRDYLSQCSWMYTSPFPQGNETARSASPSPDTTA